MLLKKSLDSIVILRQVSAITSGSMEQDHADHVLRFTMTEEKNTDVASLIVR